MAPKTFFDLLTEIRNIVYRLAFPMPTDAILKLPMKRDQAVIKPGQILRTSKTFNIEAAPFIYGTRNFVFGCIFNAICSLMTTGKSHSALLISIDTGRFSCMEYETIALHWVFRCDFEDVLPATSEPLAQSCPQLHYVKFFWSTHPTRCNTYEAHRQAG